MTDIRLSSQASFGIVKLLGSDRKMPTGSLRFEGLSESVEYRYYIDGNEFSDETGGARLWKPRVGNFGAVRRVLRMKGL